MGKKDRYNGYNPETGKRAIAYEVFSGVPEKIKELLNFLKKHEIEYYEPVDLVGGLLTY